MFNLALYLNLDTITFLTNYVYNKHLIKINIKNKTWRFVYVADILVPVRSLLCFHWQLPASTLP